MNSARLLRFQTVLCSKVHQLHFSRNDIYNIQFKISHDEKEFIAANVWPSLSSQKKLNPSTIPVKVNERDYKKPKIILLRKQKNTNQFNEKKKIDSISMLKYIPLIDKQHYKTVGVK